MGAIFSSIGRGINAVIFAIGGVLTAIVSAVTSVIVTIFNVIGDILCCRCCGSRGSTAAGTSTRGGGVGRRRRFGLEETDIEKLRVEVD